ncbi:MAG: hypothetical protein ACJ791_07625, partial [Gemmatimonadaceae bacterium]
MEGAAAVIAEYVRYIQWPWALVLTIVLPIVTVWLIRWGLRARAQRLARLGTPSMVSRLAPSILRQRTWVAAL